MNHRLHRTSYNQIDLRIRFVDVPNLLHIAEHRCIEPHKLLKLVDKQGYGLVLRQLHDVIEYIRKPGYPTQHRNTQLGTYLLLIRFA